MYILYMYESYSIKPRMKEKQKNDKERKGRKSMIVNVCM